MTLLLSLLLGEVGYPNTSKYRRETWWTEFAFGQAQKHTGLVASAGGTRAKHVMEGKGR